MIRVLEALRPDLRRTWRDWRADGSATGIAMVLGFLLVLGQLAENPASTFWIARELVVGPLCLVIVLLYRRRWPASLALVMTAASMAATAPVGALAVMLFTAAAHRPWPVPIAIASLHLTMLAVLMPFDNPSQREYLEALIFLALAEGVTTATGMLVRSHRLLVTSLRDRARQAEEGQRMRMDEARRLERERIAREMHDVLAHRISLLTVHAGALEYRPQAPAADVSKAAGIIRQCAFEALEDLREVLGVLRHDADGGQDADRPQPTLADIPGLLDEARHGGTPVTLDDRISDLGSVPVGIGRHAYRIVQEGLTNARKHAPGARVRVAMEGKPGTGLTVELRNPVPPQTGAAIPGAGAGLTGLRERVDLAGGELEHGRMPGGDFRLWMSLPWPA